ncbi:MAG TPA: PorV/PorQ family protein [Spirochaetota bacterium]|nr:PorV/PorQ family protein [Spirochaetota bacterium]HPI90923.1 PorV/PorQ family protein [Spirochaetota bacterium]HPR48395.1 PorV/PorQ family protein [Spirochaetota bacterium]
MKIHILTILCAVLTVCAPVYAAETIGTSGADFLEIGVGSRSLGMAEAFTSMVEDINTLYYNPAGLGSLKYPILSIQHQELILDSRYENISFSYPIHHGNIAVSNSIFWVPPFDKIDINGNKTGDVTFYSGVLTVGYGYDFDFMYLGGSLKYVYQQIDTMDVHSFAIDVGVLKGMYLYSPFDVPSRNFHIGISFLNLGSNAHDDPLPRMLRLGLSYKLTNWFGLYVDLTENIIEASDLYDFIYGFEESFRVNIGAEISLFDIVSFRAGYKLNDGQTYSFGVGFNFVIKNVTFNIDTHYADSGVFGPTYSFNIGFKLIPKVVTVQDKMDAQAHYKKGIKHFIDNQIPEAINEFKTAKDYDPYYKNIDRKIDDLKEIEKLKKENEELEQELKKLESD